MSNTQVVNSQFVIEFEPNPSIRKRVFDFEEKLEAYFQSPFRSIPVADNVDPKIPRFESQSKNGHSLLQVSGTRLVMKTNYDDQFKGHLEKIDQYIKERASIFNSLLKPEKKLFIAYIIELQFNLEKSSINSFFKEKTGVKAINDQTIDINLLYSFPYKNKFYLNLKCSKFQNVEIVFKDGKINQTSNVSNGVSVNIDINSRLQLNKGLKFDEKIITDISNTIFTLIENNDLSNFLSGEIVE